MISTHLHLNAKFFGGATEDDLRNAAERCDGEERIAAIWRIPSDVASSAACASFPPALFLPCFWPHLAVLSPCLISGYCTGVSLFEGTTYFLTDKALHVLVDASVGGCLYRTGKDSGQVGLNEIKSIVVNNAASGLCAGFSPSTLDVQVPYGSPVANSGGSSDKSPGTFKMFVQNPDEARKLLMAAKNAFVGSSAGGSFAGGIIAPGSVQMAIAEKKSPGEKLVKLKELLDIGAVTQEEFDSKKKELLSRM